jgi:L-phenylalanine/L-methionine N-acetyltransferase
VNRVLEGIRPIDLEYVMSLTIRRATVNDAASYARIMGDPRVFPTLLQMPYGDEELWRSRLQSSAPAGSGHVPLVAEEEGRVIGIGGLHPAGSERRRHVAVLGMAVAPEAWGRGVGTALMQALCDHADNWSGVLRIELGVFTDNEAAIRLYRKFGFEMEGRRRGDALRDGRYVDTFAMARWHPSPPGRAE